jgi:hypothetical protein
VGVLAQGVELDEPLRHLGRLADVASGSMVGEELLQGAGHEPAQPAAFGPEPFLAARVADRNAVQELALKQVDGPLQVVGSVASGEPLERHGVHVHGLEIERELLALDVERRCLEGP